jgi:hypothetical protein
MIKIIKVENLCNKCQFFEVKRHFTRESNFRDEKVRKLFCNKSLKALKEYEVSTWDLDDVEIPEWCELEDYKESPHFKLGMFHKLIMNGHLFSKQVTKFLLNFYK